MTRDELRSEGVVAKFVRYAQINTESDADGAGIPTTPGQRALAELLAAELRTIGMHDVVVDEHAFVTATLPGANPGAPTVGFLAHLDTSPAVTGAGVQPLVHRNYGGGDIRLPSGAVLREAEHPALARVVGHDLITSSGDTLLGADDKAGVADIMEALCRLLGSGKPPAATVRVAFTPDEENGRGIELLDIERFGADFAYTLDGGALGEFEDENFNAENVKVVITGRSAHTGTARGRMINALHLAAQMIGAIPAAMRPETTDGREGFIHCDQITGDVERIEMVWLLRDFAKDGLARKRTWLCTLAATVEQGSGGATVRTELIRGYENMQEVLADAPHVADLALSAMAELGIEPIRVPIRGGTDGARLTAAGLPTPNLFAGGMNFHSRTEWASAQWMERAVEVILKIVELAGVTTG